MTGMFHFRSVRSTRDTAEAFTLRGLHFQMGEHAQAKMVSCLHGSIFNVAVDLRPGKCFGYSYSEVLSLKTGK